MNRILPFALSLVSVLTLAGCAGTASDFECNATTSDTCMTIEQANEKAKRLEESAVKPDAAALPRLAEGNFRTASAQPLTPSPVPAQSVASRSAPSGGSHFVANPFARPVDVKPASKTAPVVAPQPTYESIVDPRPLRLGEKIAGLWIAPYIDTRDVYHQPGRVFFVVKPSAWGKPRVN